MKLSHCRLQQKPSGKYQKLLQFSIPTNQLVILERKLPDGRTCQDYGCNYYSTPWLKSQSQSVFLSKASDLRMTLQIKWLSVHLVGYYCLNSLPLWNPLSSLAFTTNQILSSLLATAFIEKFHNLADDQILVLKTFFLECFMNLYMSSLHRGHFFVLFLLFRDRVPLGNSSVCRGIHFID